MLLEEVLVKVTVAGTCPLLDKVNVKAAFGFIFVVTGGLDSFLQETENESI